MEIPARPSDHIPLGGVCRLEGRSRTPNDHVLLAAKGRVQTVYRGGVSLTQPQSSHTAHFIRFSSASGGPNPQFQTLSIFAGTVVEPCSGSTDKTMGRGTEVPMKRLMICAFAAVTLLAAATVMLRSPPTELFAATAAMPLVAGAPHRRQRK